MINTVTFDARQISDESAWITNALWPKKKKAIYFISNQGGSDDLWRVGIDVFTGQLTGKPVQLTYGSNFGHAAISREGDRLLLQRITGSEYIKRLSLQKENYRNPQMALDLKFARFPRIENIEVSPDGSKFILEAFHFGVRSLVLVSIDNGKDKVLYNKQEAFAPSWSHDGKWIAFDAGGGNNADIWRIPATGGSAEKIVAHPGADWLPTYSPDGKHLCFISKRTGLFDLWLKDLHSGETRQLTNTTNIESRGFWSHDGNNLAFYRDDENNEISIVTNSQKVELQNRFKFWYIIFID